MTGLFPAPPRFPAPIGACHHTMGCKRPRRRPPRALQEIAGREVMGLEILRVENIEEKYQAQNGEVTALENISFSMDKGEFMSIVGPSGCGKSTLLSILAGLLKPTAGAVYVKGKRSRASPATSAICCKRTACWTGAPFTATCCLDWKSGICSPRRPSTGRCSC